MESVNWAGSRVVCSCGLDLQREGVQTSHTIRQPWVEALLSTYIQGNRLSGVELVYLDIKTSALDKCVQNRTEQALGHGHAHDK